MGTFNFKRFSVVNERSAMKVNTDGVLLGAAMTIHSTDRSFLDVGTGTGTIALMTAQRISDLLAVDLDVQEQFRVDAVDLDEPSIQEASANFQNSPWGDAIQAHHAAFDEFAQAHSTFCYDLIFSNPPYFEDSLLAPQERRSQARHTATGLSYRELLDFAKTALSEDGRFSIVLPSDQEVPLCRYARMSGLHLFRILRVRTVPRKDPTRIIAEFSRHRCDSPTEELLTIQNEGKYTDEYHSLTRDFYLFA